MPAINAGSLVQLEAYKRWLLVVALDGRAAGLPASVRGWRGAAPADATPLPSLAGTSAPVVRDGLPVLPRSVAPEPARLLATHASTQPYVELARAFSHYARLPGGATGSAVAAATSIAPYASAGGGAQPGYVAARDLPAVLQSHAAVWQAEGTLPLVMRVLPTADACRVARLRDVFAVATLGQVGNVLGTAGPAATVAALRGMVGLGTGVV